MIKKFDEFIKESYNNFGLIKSKSNYYLINESQESKSQSEAIKLVMDKWGWDHAKADKFIRIDLRNDITPLRDKQIGKFTLGVTRMYCDKQITDARTISDLNATLKLLTAHLNEYDRNLNGLSVEELISKFKQARENNVKKEKNEINRMKFGVSDYEIVKIDSFSGAKKYYKYTNPESRWCLTHMKDMYDSYTCNGINQIYFCLKHGFKDIKPIVGENAPLDEYGLSMLSIIVNEEGELAFCTCRWNHDNGGNDSAMNSVEISKVVNVNFYETFKPNTKWKDMVDNVKRRLANGESPEKIFDYVDDFNEGYAKVKLNNKCNFINKNGEILSDKWFDNVGIFEDGYAKVKLNDKWNFINTDGEILSNKWFDWVYYFREEGYAKVVLNDTFNLINKNGEILSDKWFDEAYTFNEGYAGVKLNDKWNFINKNGEIVFDKWFDYVYKFNEGYARVKLNDKWNFINTNGEYLSDKWFDDIVDFSEGYTRVLLNDKWNFINTDGEIISDKWFDFIGVFEDGYAKVEFDNKWNFINTDGEIISDKWFDDVVDFKDDYSKVKLNKKYNFINKNGEIIYDKWFDEVNDFSEDYARVVLNDKYNFINKSGKIISDKWFDYVFNFKKGYARVVLNKKHNFINKNGEIISDTWFDGVYIFIEGYAVVELNNKCNFINKNGEIMLDKWFNTYKEANDALNNLLKK